MESKIIDQNHNQGEPSMSKNLNFIGLDAEDNSFHFTTYFLIMGEVLPHSL